MNTDRAAVITYKHIARVRQLLGESPTMNLEAACDKYKIDGPLRSILFNTAKRLGYQP